LVEHDDVVGHRERINDQGRGSRRLCELDDMRLGCVGALVYLLGALDHLFADTLLAGAAHRAGPGTAALTECTTGVTGSAFAVVVALARCAILTARFSGATTVLTLAGCAVVSRVARSALVTALLAGRAARLTRPAAAIVM